jgi:hypothetical protein
MGIDVEKLPGERTRVRSATMSSYSRRIKPGVLVMRQFGHDDSIEMATAMMRELSQIIDEDGSVTVFCDLRGVNRFDSKARTVWLDFFKSHGAKFKGGYALINSKLVDMAVSIIGMALGSQRARSTTRESEFLRELQSVAPGFTAQDFAQLADRPSVAQSG